MDRKSIYVNYGAAYHLGEEVNPIREMISTAHTYLGMGIAVRVWDFSVNESR